MMHPTGEIVDLLPQSGYVCWVIPRLFSQTQCALLLTDAIKRSFQQASSHYPTSYRNNDRLVVDVEHLSWRLFEQVKPFLPDTIRIQSGNPMEEGTWRLRELNSRLRYCRYSAGQYFHRHLDGVHYRSARIQSKLTFMLYLNSADEFGGGRTLFYRSKDSQEVWASYLPQQGDLILFDHNLWHEGEVLTTGQKYVLRSDILYERQTTEEASKPQPPTPYQEGHLGYIWTLLSFNQRLLVSGGRDKIIKVWDEQGVCQQRLLGHQNSILCLARINERTLLSGSRDRTIKVWQLEKEGFGLQAEFQIHQAAVLSLCRLSDQLFASGGGDKLIRIVDLEGEVMRSLEGHQDWVWQVLALPNGHLASCSEDKTIKIWNYQTGECLVTLPEDCPIHCLALDYLISFASVDQAPMVVKLI